MEVCVGLLLTKRAESAREMYGTLSTIFVPLIKQMYLPTYVTSLSQKSFEIIFITVSNVVMQWIVLSAYYLIILHMSNYAIV